MWRLERIMLVTALGSCLCLAVAACSTPVKPGGPSPTPTNPGATPSPAVPAVPDPPLAFDRDGVSLGEPADGQFTVYADTAYYMRDDLSATDIPTLIAADLVAGKPRWSKPVATDAMAAKWGPIRVAVVEGKARVLISYLARLKGSGTQADRELLRVIALDAGDGTRLWTVDIDDDKMPQGPAYRFSTFSPPSIVAFTDEHVVLGTEESVIVLDSRNGNQRWNSAGFRPSALDAGTVVGASFSGTTRKVAGRSALDGKESWSNADPFDRVEQLGSGLVAVASTTATRLLEAKTGTVKANVAGSHTCAHDSESIVVCWRFTEHVLAIDATNGKTLWELPDTSADRIIPRVLTLRRGMIYSTAGSNGPVIIDARTGKDKVTTVVITPTRVIPGFGLVLSERGGLFAHKATG